jgi:hypothetical protein
VGRLAAATGLGPPLAALLTVAVFMGSALLAVAVGTAFMFMLTAWGCIDIFTSLCKTKKVATMRVRCSRLDTNIVDCL